MRDRDVGQRDGEEDDNGADDETGVERGGGDVVVRLPPPVKSRAHAVVKDEPDNGPAGEAEGRRRREPAHGAEHDGRMEDLCELEVEDFGQDVEDDG